MECDQCIYHGQGTKVCPICYQRLIQERDKLKKELILEKENVAKLNQRLEEGYDEFHKFMGKEFRTEIDFYNSTLKRFKYILKGE